MKSCSPKKRAERLVRSVRTYGSTFVEVEHAIIGEVYEHIRGNESLADDLANADVDHLRRILTREFRRAERRGERRALKMAAHVAREKAADGSCGWTGCEPMHAIADAIELLLSQPTPERPDIRKLCRPLRGIR